MQVLQIRKYLETKRAIHVKYIQIIICNLEILMHVLSPYFEIRILLIELGSRKWNQVRRSIWKGGCAGNINSRRGKSVGRRAHDNWAHAWSFITRQGLIQAHWVILFKKRRSVLPDSNAGSGRFDSLILIIIPQFLQFYEAIGKQGNCRICARFRKGQYRGISLGKTLGKKLTGSS